MTSTMKAALAVGAVLAVGAITFEATKEEAATVVREDWPDGGKPQAIDCYRITGLTTSKEYVAVIECVPDGAKPVIRDLHIVALEPIADQLTKREVFEKGQVGGFECACSTGRDCEQLTPASAAFRLDGGWIPAPVGNYLRKGQFRGVGCFLKNCVENAGDVVWPSECPGG